MLIGVLLIPNHAVAQPVYTNALGMSFQTRQCIFQMGEASPIRMEAFGIASPTHPVRINQAYWIEISEINNVQY